VEFAPDFATDWSSSPDGLTWTFHTQPDAKWSDGQPLTADDVAWTYQTIIKFKDTVTGAAAGSVAHLKNVDAPDATTVVFTYDVPVPAVLAGAQQVSILPKHVWSQYAAGDGKELKTYPNTPTDGAPVVSGGPFMVTQYQQDQVTLFQRNPNYYGPAPHIDGFGLQYFSNEDAEVTAMKNDEIDVIENVPPTSVTTLQDAGFNVYTGDALTYRTFIINSSPYKKDHLELLDPKVREAFEYATDRQKIVDTAWLGYATPGSTIVPPSTGAWHDSGIQPLPFDIAKANELLDGLGFTMGSDGIRVADGHPMQYDVLFPGSERGAGDRAFQIIQADYAQIGVKLVQRPVTGAYSIMTAPDNRYENWDLAMWNWTPPIDPDFILSVMTCDSFGDWSDSGYCNKAYDQLYAKQGQTLDQKERQQIAYQMQQMVFDDRPYIVLVYNDTIDAWSTGWDGFVQSSQGLFSALTKLSLTSVHQV
jgi:peptide/nickel transport system substrate-binding protein